jgi:demethylmenaquinone methyltransferase/2-methoxy-6-polyprenyl-1,4-benzoquinol methylase
VETERNRSARRLFAGIAPEYDRMGALLSFGQDPRWRRLLVSKVAAPPGSWVLDVASGTGLVARELALRNLRVAALDQSEAMVRRGVSEIAGSPSYRTIRFLLGRAEALPFADETFDALTFTYLLRYVDDPGATIRELSRVLRPGGVMAALEFYVPPEPWAQLGWRAYTRAVMPAIGLAMSGAWYRTGRFLGPSIEEFVRRYPLPVQVRMWQEAGLRRVRTTTLAMGAAVVMWAVKRSALTDG